MSARGYKYEDALLEIKGKIGIIKVFGTPSISLLDMVPHSCLVVYIYDQIDQAVYSPIGRILIDSTTQVGGVDFNTH